MYHFIAVYIINNCNLHIYMKTILVTGGAGFIGSHLIKKLLSLGHTVVTIDNFAEINYEKKIKIDRLRTFLGESDYRYGDTIFSSKKEKFTFYHGDLNDANLIKKIFTQHSFDVVVHLAAHGGVRNSLLHPQKYIRDNVAATVAIFEAAAQHKVKHVLYASSSSVYGGNKEMPFREDQKTDDPLAPYPASKKSCELFAQAYHNAYGIQMTGLRFFTVYGPWGRPDMALYIFAKNICENKPIDVYNQGKMRRDFTYIDDIISGVIKLIDTEHGHEVFNLACGKTEELCHFIDLIEDCLEKKAQRNLMEMQNGDVPASFGDISKAKKHAGYESTTTIDIGIKNFIDWFKEYHNI